MSGFNPHRTFRSGATYGTRYISNFNIVSILTGLLGPVQRMARMLAYLAADVSILTGLLGPVQRMGR